MTSQRSLQKSTQPARPLVGRLFDPEGGPCLVHLRGDRLVDVTAAGPTMSDLLERDGPGRRGRRRAGAGASYRRWTR